MGLIKVYVGLSDMTASLQLHAFDSSLMSHHSSALVSHYDSESEVTKSCAASTLPTVNIQYPSAASAADSGYCLDSCFAMELNSKNEINVRVRTGSVMGMRMGWVLVGVRIGSYNKTRTEYKQPRSETTTEFPCCWR